MKTDWSTGTQPAHSMTSSTLCCFFFFNDTATTEIYTLSLHDALPIYQMEVSKKWARQPHLQLDYRLDRKSTRLNSSHLVISYAVFCLKKKKNETCRVMSHQYGSTRLVVPALVAAT